jgi:hypothetical protein
MQISENKFRDFLFSSHKESISDLIYGKREPIKWQGDGFPPISILLQQIVEKKINRLVDGLDSLILSAKELRLEKAGKSTTRIDLFGHSESIGLMVIELKKSTQTERQAFTELLAYANHFCSIFPGLKESAINTVLIAPMETRIVRDAFLQEVLSNNKSSVALIPVEQGHDIKLRVYYPDESYYKWYENNLLDDRSMSMVAIAFQEIKGWIDTDINNNQMIPNHSKDALNTISSSISNRLEEEGFHSLVYATQQWGEIAQLFPYANIIYVVYVNPFAFFRNSFDNDQFFGETADGRVAEIQSIYDQLDKQGRDYWLDNMESNYTDFAFDIVKEEFDKCFRDNENQMIMSEISLPNWYSIKRSMIDSVCTHNLDVFQTGLLRKIYSEYIDYIYEVKLDEIYYFDDLPKYSYETLRDFLPVWSILSGLGLGESYWGDFEDDFD